MNFSDGSGFREIAVFAPKRPVDLVDQFDTMEQSDSLRAIR